MTSFFVIHADGQRQEDMELQDSNGLEEWLNFQSSTFRLDSCSARSGVRATNDSSRGRNSAPTLNAAAMATTATAATRSRLRLLVTGYVVAPGGRACE
jgi:hypothetical protein